MVLQRFAPLALVALASAAFDGSFESYFRAAQFEEEQAVQQASQTWQMAQERAPEVQQAAQQLKANVKDAIDKGADNLAQQAPDLAGRINEEKEAAKQHIDDLQDLGTQAWNDAAQADWQSGQTAVTSDLAALQNLVTRNHSNEAQILQQTVQQLQAGTQAGVDKLQNKAMTDYQRIQDTALPALNKEFVDAQNVAQGDLDELESIATENATAFQQATQRGQQDLNSLFERITKMNQDMKEEGVQNAVDDNKEAVQQDMEALKSELVKDLNIEKPEIQEAEGAVQKDYQNELQTVQGKLLDAQNSDLAKDFQSQVPFAEQTLNDMKQSIVGPLTGLQSKMAPLGGLAFAGVNHSITDVEALTKHLTNDLETNTDLANAVSKEVQAAQNDLATFANLTQEAEKESPEYQERQEELQDALQKIKAAQDGERGPEMQQLLQNLGAQGDGPDSGTAAPVEAVVV